MATEPYKPQQNELVEEFFEQEVQDPLQKNEDGSPKSQKKLMVKLFGGEFNKPVREATDEDKSKHQGAFQAFQDKREFEEWKQRKVGGPTEGGQDVTMGQQPSGIPGRASPDEPAETRDTKERADASHHQSTPLTPVAGPEPVGQPVPGPQGETKGTNQ